MNHQDLINSCIFEPFQVLLFSDLSGPLINDDAQDVVRRWFEARQGTSRKVFTLGTVEAKGFLAESVYFMSHTKVAQPHPNQ